MGTMIIDGKKNVKSYEEIAEETTKRLTENTGWIERYKKYYNEICRNSKFVTLTMHSFRAKDPLTKYLSIGRVVDSSNTVSIDLRINGHSIASYSTELNDDIKNAMHNKESDAEIKKKIRKNSSLQFKSSGLKKVASSDESIKNDFETLADKYGDSTIPWNSKKASDFRKAIRIESKSTHSEHTIESQLLKRLSSSESKGKPIVSIQPIKLCDAFFQLVTPLKASEAGSKDKVEYSKDKEGRDHSGGGIDILARVIKENNNAELCVIELKDKYTENENPTLAIKQAIAYATFIDCLIRSEEARGKDWYKKIFGIGKAIDETITINAMVAMPYENIDNSISEEDKALANYKIPLRNGDIIELHYFFFDKYRLYDDMKASCSLKTRKRGSANLNDMNM